jgi:(2Fe-2S) ferredoxin/signal-transduction protein with cAMP-binding, CBS, and nucleotidyltransferase domain
MIGIDFLQSVGIFKGLDDNQLIAVQDCCREEQHKAGTQLFGEGEPASHLYIVKTGQVDLRFDLPGRPTSEKNTLSSIQEFKAFGWSSLVAPYKYSLSAYCATRSCEVIKIDGQCLTRIFHEDNRLGYLVLSNMVRVIGKRFQKIEKLATAAPVSMVKVIVHLATCGIVAGARDVMDALMDEMNRSGRSDIKVESSGCLGKCPTEPNVTIKIEGQNPVVYQKMDSEKMRQVFNQHVLGGQIQTDFVLNE